MPRPGLGPRPQDPMKPNKLPKLSPQAEPVTFLERNQGSNPSHDPGDQHNKRLGALITALSWDQVHQPQAFEALVSLSSTHTHWLHTPSHAMPCLFPPFQTTLHSDSSCCRKFPIHPQGQLRCCLPWDSLPDSFAPSQGSPTEVRKPLGSIWGFVLVVSLSHGPDSGGVTHPGP